MDKKKSMLLLICLTEILIVIAYKSKNIPQNNHIKRIKTNFPTIQCGCQQHIIRNVRRSSISGNTAHSHCNYETLYLHGNHQKVISYSAFNPKEKLAEKNPIPFFSTIRANLLNMIKFYPNYVMRVYTNLPSNYWQLIFCPLVCNYPTKFTVCDVNNLPAFRNVGELMELSWRYFVLGDPDVDMFLIRSLDHLLGERELSVVREFENSTFWFHNIRDHPMETWVISTAFLGGKNSLIGGDFAMELLEEFIKKLKMTPKTHEILIKIYHQELLQELIYDKYNSKLMTHDSYLCEIYDDQHWFPFPKQRLNRTDFVGAFTDINGILLLDVNVEECPIKCRPDFGKNWIYC